MSNNQWAQGDFPPQQQSFGMPPQPPKKNWLPLGIGVAVVLLIVLGVLVFVLVSGEGGGESAPATSSSASESQPESPEEPSDLPSDEPSEPAPSDDPLASDVPLKPFPEQVRGAQLYDPGDDGIAAFYKTEDGVLYGASVYPNSMDMDILVRDLSNTQVIQGWKCGFEAVGELPRCVIDDPKIGKIAVSTGKDLQDLAAWGDEFRKLY